MPLPYVAFGAEDLRGRPAAGSTASCPHCHAPHPVKYADELLPDGTRQPSRMVGFVECGKNSYLVALNGVLLPTRKPN